MAVSAVHSIVWSILRFRFGQLAAFVNFAQQAEVIWVTSQEQDAAHEEVQAASRTKRQ